ncbi:hypothetical protein [Yinghuangia seranimata]|uniref:hypothetical protein n=1 Tax=Yinghuangia seranimata TaxID=408067 RepID=UPI00248C36CB|nr:hypothetical protein [Yinghuangia seranimata]MDI2127352.1 hypothetical protein [Yinghuangia seranimata]
MTAPDRSRPLVRTARRGRPDPGTPNGNAPYGSRRPGIRDRAFSVALRPTAAVWRITGLKHSAATLRHYYGQSGQRFVVDPEGPLETAPFRKVADRHLEEWRDLAVARWRASGGHETEFDATTNWHGVRIGKGDHLDWWLALRGLQYRMTGRVDIDEDGVVRIVYEVEVYKDWGFDKGEDEYGLSFTPLARLHEAGLAREYTVVGRSRPLVWTAPPAG